MHDTTNTLIVRILAVICLLASIAPVSHAEYNKVVSYLEGSLADKKTSADSLAVLANLYDIQATILGRDAYVAANRAYETAMRAENYELALEMIRQKANLSQRNIDALDSLLIDARAIPDGPHKDETITFVRVMRNIYYSSYNSSEQENADYFVKKLKELTQTKKEDIYEKIVLLHAIMLGVAQVAQGDLMLKYQKELGHLIESLPPEEFSLRNWYYVQSANTMGDIGYGEGSMDADKKLLKCIEDLQKYYNSNGRPYRNYDANKYVIYTRLLSNWENLNDDEVEEYYQKAIKFKDKDERARRSFMRSPDPDIFYAMYKKNYAKAHDLLKGAVYSGSQRLSRRLKFMKYLISTSQKVGDQETTLSASADYIRLLEETMASRVQEKAKELQIVYDTYGLRNSIVENAAASQQSVNRLQRSIILICIGALIGLIILVVILVRQFRHSRKLTDTLYKANLALEHESAALKASQNELQEARDSAEKANRFKSDFIQNLGREINVPLTAVNEYAHLIVDCADADKKTYLQSYADQVDVNCEYISTIINDVFHLSEIDSDSVSIRNKLVDVNEEIELAIDGIKHRSLPGVRIVFNPDKELRDTFTDPRRLQQIVTKLIINAINNVEEGEVVVTSSLTPDNRFIQITIADEGPCIPVSQSEQLFERFYKLDKETPGLGIGLHISRVIARLMGGDLALDTTYQKGTRFILSIPYRDKER